MERSALDWATDFSRMPLNPERAVSQRGMIPPFAGHSQLVEGRTPWATPFYRPAIDPARQVKLVLEEPKKRLPHTAEFGDLVDGECDRRLDTTVGILLQAFACFKETNRRGYHEFTTPRLLIARRQRALDYALS